MKTTSEQLLARAEELEARARACRISAAEMNGHQTAEKQTKVGELFQAAGKIRKAVKIWEEPEPPAPPALPPLPNKKRFTAAELAPRILPLLNGATRTTMEVRNLLAAQGLDYNGSHMRQILTQLPQVKRMGGGKGTDVRWQLRSGPQGKRIDRPAPRTVRKWTPTQHRKFVAIMKRKAAERAAAATS